MLKKLILSTFLILFGLSTVFAQKEEKSPEEKAEAFASEMQSVIGFDDKDKEKIKEAQLKRLEAMNDLKEKIKSKYPTKEEREEKKNLIKDEFQADKADIKQKFNERIYRVITEAQFEKWREYKKDLRAQGGKGNGKGGGKGKGEKGNGGGKGKGNENGGGKGNDNDEQGRLICNVM
jgi:hypothetical protein